MLLGDARLDLGHLHGYQEDDDESGRGAMEIIDGNPLEGCSGGVSTRKYGHNRGAWAENKAVITVRDALLLSPHPPLYGSIITSALLLSPSLLPSSPSLSLFPPSIIPSQVDACIVHPILIPSSGCHSLRGSASTALCWREIRDSSRRRKLSLQLSPLPTRARLHSCSIEGLVGFRPIRLYRLVCRGTFVFTSFIRQLGPSNLLLRIERRPFQSVLDFVDSRCIGCSIESNPNRLDCAIDW